MTIKDSDSEFNFTSFLLKTRAVLHLGESVSVFSSLKLSFGGIPLPGKPGTFLRKNFNGCMENLYYNGINVIDLAKRRKPQIHSVVSCVVFHSYRAACVLSESVVY